MNKMCVPCKVIIDEEAQNSAKMGDRLRQLLVNRLDDNPEADDFLYELARYEVDYIKSTHKMAVKFAKEIKAPKRWVDLLEEIA